MVWPNSSITENTLTILFDFDGTLSTFFLNLLLQKYQGSSDPDKIEINETNISDPKTFYGLRSSLIKLLEKIDISPADFNFFPKLCDDMTAVIQSSENQRKPKVHCASISPRLICPLREISKSSWPSVSFNLTQWHRKNPGKKLTEEAKLELILGALTQKEAIKIITGLLSKAFQQVVFVAVEPKYFYNNHWMFGYPSEYRKINEEDVKKALVSKYLSKSNLVTVYDGSYHIIRSLKDWWQAKADDTHTIICHVVHGKKRGNVLHQQHLPPALPNLLGQTRQIQSSLQ